MYKGLILCHPKNVYVDENGKIVNHWYSDVMKENFSDFIFETVDILNGGTYQDDCFSDKFINLHTAEYDILISPDAGGKWYKLQEGKDLFSFKILLINMLKFLKQTCIIILDKFIYPEFRKLSVEILQEFGFNIIPKTYDMYGHEYKKTIYAERI